MNDLSVYTEEKMKGLTKSREALWSAMAVIPLSEREQLAKVYSP